MDYQIAAKRFDFENYVTKYINSKEPARIILDLRDEISKSEQISIPRNTPYRNDIEHLQSEYIHKIKSLGFIFMQVRVHLD